MREILAQVRDYLYPPFLATSTAVAKKTKVPKGNGGWGDRRDVRLCEAVSRPLGEAAPGGDTDRLLDAARNADMTKKKKKKAAAATSEAPQQRRQPGRERDLPDREVVARIRSPVL